MAYEGPFSKRQLDNMVHIVETELQFSADGQVTNADPIVLDATESFSKTTTGRVTDNPVGDKSDRGDHYRVYSPSLKFSGVISNDMMVSLLGLGGATPVYDWLFSEESEARCQQYIERLQKIFDEKRMVEIRMPDGLTTSNCLITSLTVSRAKGWDNGFRISIAAKQVQVSTDGIQATPIATEKDVVEEPVDAGNKTGQGFEETDQVIPDTNVPAGTTTAANTKRGGYEWLLSSKGLIS